MYPSLSFGPQQAKAASDTSLTHLSTLCVWHGIFERSMSIGFPEFTNDFKSLLEMNWSSGGGVTSVFFSN